MRGAAIFVLLLFVGIVVAFVISAASKSIGGMAVPADLNSGGEAGGETDEPESGPEAAVLPESREGSVYISDVSVYDSGRKARVVLRTNLAEGESVDITSWMIRTNKRRLFIPEAVRVYRVGGSNSEGHIVLDKGNYVILYAGGSSPVGRNFRVNACTGYLNNRYEFEASLPNDCPLPERDSYKHLAGWCQDYIRSMERCGLPDANETNEWRGDDGNACRSFVYDFFNVDNCYRSFSESELLSDEWRVWVGAEYVFDRRHDWVKLVNKEGRVIDDYVY